MHTLFLEAVTAKPFHVFADVGTDERNEGRIERTTFLCHLMQIIGRADNVVQYEAVGDQVIVFDGFSLRAYRWC